MKTERSSLPLKIAGIYVFWASLWILLSDRALAWAAGDRPDGAWAYVASVKGLLFVVVTGLLLHQLLVRVLVRLEHAKAVLRAQEQRWKLALEAVGDGVWEHELNSTQAYYSRGWKHMLGYAEHEIGGTLEEWISRIHPEDGGRVETERQHYLTQHSGRAYRSEYRMRAKDGSYRWILARGSLVAVPGDGEKLRMIGTHTDITSRKSSEGRMADTLAFTKAVLHCSPTGIIAFKETGGAVIANDSAARILGAAVPDLLRQNFRTLDSWQQSGLLAVANEALASGEEKVHRGMLVSSVGSTLWIEAHLAPFTYQEEKHLLLLLNDETAEHRAAGELHLMKAAAQAAPVGWVVTDAAGRIEWINPAFTALTGYTSAEVIGRTPRLLKSGRQPAEYYTTMWAAIRRGDVWSGELINRRKDGSHYHEFNTIAPVRGKHGAITHFVAIKQDISERKQLEVQLSRAQRIESIGQLACGMVHDLNNMLAPIMLSLGMIRRQHADPETQTYVQMMENAVQRGAGVLRQVLTFAKGVEGERTLLEPKHLIKEVGQLAQETFPRQIKIVMEVDPGVGLVSGDLTQVHQVLLNLAVNARDAMPEGGVLTFHARNVIVDEARAVRQVVPVKPGTYVCLGVRDTGSGIRPEVLERMFEPFFTTKPRGKGTGLGLATVFGIMRSYGGFIEVTTKLGEGTDMGALFPAVARPLNAERPIEQPTVPLHGGGRRVLVVEDEAYIRDVIVEVLTKRQFKVISAHDGQDALAKFIADPAAFSAVITDLMMPNLNGYELARQVRQRAPRLPILASSGLSEEAAGENSGEKLRALGIHLVLPKPYTEAELLRALAQALENDPGDGL